MQPAEWVTYMILCDPSHCKPCVSLHGVNCDESAEVAPPIEQGLTYTESNVILLHASLGIPWAREEHLGEASEFCSSGMTIARQRV